MPSLLVRWRTLTFGVSCLLHLGLIAVVLLAEQALWAHVWQPPPVLPVELVMAPDPPQPEPPPRVIERPKPVPPRPLTLPKPIETPLPKMLPKVTESEPAPPPEPLQAPEPPAPAPPAPAAPLPPPLAAPLPAPPAAAAMNPTGSTDREPGPPVRPGPAVTAPRPAPATGSGDGIPLGRPSPSPGSGQPGAGRVASASGRDAGSTGAITQSARPQSGQAHPGYPATARRLGIEGTTLLKVYVLVDGRVGDVVVQQSGGHPDFDRAATDAVRRWRFDPARSGNDPVAAWVVQPFEFRLK